MRDPELAEIEPDSYFLQSLAKAYADRGAYRAAGDDAPPLVDEDAVRIITEQRQTSLAAMPIAGLLFALFASFAWWIRRRNGGR